MQRTPDDPQRLAAEFASAAARGDHAAALRLVDRLMSLMPGHAGLAYNRALVLKALGRRPEARAGLASALALDPDHGKARFEAAALDLEDGDHARAAEGFAAVLAADPSDDDARLNLGNALIRLGRSAEALAALAPLRGRRRDPAALLAMARAEADVGDLDAADALLADLPQDDPAVAAAALKLRTQGPRGRFRLSVAQPGPIR